MHGGNGDDAMSGAEALPFYYDNARNPLKVLANLAAYYAPGNLLGYTDATATFSFFNLSDPFSKIMLRDSHGNVIADFLLNFTSGTIWTPVDDGQDVLFGDGGNDWIVGGTNSDHLYGGDGNDLLQADDNLDSTFVDVPVTYDSLKALVLQYSTSQHDAQKLIDDLSDAQYQELLGRTSNKLHDLDQFSEGVLDNINELFTGDQAAILTRLVQALRGTSPYANNIPDPRSSQPSNADLAFGGPGRDILIANSASDRLFDDPAHDDDLFVMPWTDGTKTVVRGPWDHSDDLQMLAWSDGSDGTPVPFVFTPGPGHHDGFWGWPTDGGPTPPSPALWPWWYGGGSWSSWGQWPGWNGDGHGVWPWAFGPDVELGLFYCGSHGGWDCRGGLHLAHGEIRTGDEADSGSIAFTVVATPSGFDEQLDRLKVDSVQRAILARIMIRGQLTGPEQTNLSPVQQLAYSKLVAAGYISSTSGKVLATDKLWLAIGLADAPIILTTHLADATPTNAVTLSGTGDAGDTITIYDGATAIATTTVRADGTWSVSFVLTAVGFHSLTAKQTVNQVPHQGLTSASSNTVCVDINPDAPVLAASTPAVTTTTAAVTVTGFAAGTFWVQLFDGDGKLGAAFLVTGNWTKIVSLGVGVHSLTAVYTMSTAPSFSSNASAVVVVTVYKPPPAPTVSAPANSTPSVTIGGTGSAGNTITIFDGGVQIGTAVVALDGAWTFTSTLSVGLHSLTATQTDPRTTSVSSSTANVNVIPVPLPPAVTAPATAVHNVAVGVTVTGAAGSVVLLYDGLIVIGTATLGSSGSYTFSVKFGVIGNHTLMATQSPAPGITSAVSTGFVIRIS
jgi:hypothetical protein